MASSKIEQSYKKFLWLDIWLQRKWLSERLPRSSPGGPNQPLNPSEGGSGLDDPGIDAV